MKAAFPDWLAASWQQILQTYRRGRLPHALLITGQDGVGKRLLADRLAALLLCERPDDQGNACGQCAACAWLRAGTHPDLTLLNPDEPGKAIKIDQVRALSVELGMTSHAGRYKVAVIAPADALNVNAANSLLKTLEEPTPSTLLILLTASPGRLPATVRSRCQHLRISAPHLEEALAWLQTSRGIDRTDAERCLQIAGGAPLAAAELAGSDALVLRDQRLAELSAIFNGQLDPLRAASGWSGEHEASTLRWWYAWLQALIRWQQAGQRPGEPLVAPLLQQIAEKVDCRQVFELSDRVAMALISLGSGLNRQLLMEDLLIDWARMAGRPSRSSKAAAGR
jgi:DNA polymerase-3 subunit delta'